MKRNFAMGVLGGAIGSIMVLIVLSVVGVAGARGDALNRSDAVRPESVAASPIVTSTFTYQGQLISNSLPVSNTCNFQFGLYDALSGGNRIGITQTVSSVNVNRGLFTALLNKGNEFGETAFNGDARWLQIAVACPSGGYTSLSPRQALTGLPFALPGLRTFPNATSPNIVGGFSGNSIISPAVASAIGGGGGFAGSYANIITSSYAFIGGGYHSIVHGKAAFIGGGGMNQADGEMSVVSGGYSNFAAGGRAVIGGGASNIASSNATTIGGGSLNQATDLFATVSGGSNNFARGYASTVPGGYINEATMTYTLAAGHRAKANHQGTFVWGDSTNADIASTKLDQFAIRASNGVSLSVNAGEAKVIDIGERYRDNALVAWANISSGGIASDDFGVQSIAHSTGVYTITLDATAANLNQLVPIAVAEMDGPPANAAEARLVWINIISANSFIIYVTDGTYTPQNNQIMFMATAR